MTTHPIRWAIPLVLSAFFLLIVRGAPGASMPVLTGDEDVVAVETSVPDTLDPYVEDVSETLSEFAMRPVPGGTVTVPTADGSKTVEVGPFWIKATEVKWGPYKTFVYGRDEQSSGADAVSRPTNALPYITADLGRPREGHPARAMTRKAARTYARWLSQ